MAVNNNALLNLTTTYHNHWQANSTLRKSNSLSDLYLSALDVDTNGGDDGGDMFGIPIPTIPENVQLLLKLFEQDSKDNSENLDKEPLNLDIEIDKDSAEEQGFEVLHISSIANDQNWVKSLKNSKTNLAYEIFKQDRARFDKDDLLQHLKTNNHESLRDQLKLNGVIVKRRASSNELYFATLEIDKSLIQLKAINRQLKLCQNLIDINFQTKSMPDATTTTTTSSSMNEWKWILIATMYNMNPESYEKEKLKTYLSSSLKLSEICCKILWENSRIFVQHLKKYHQEFQDLLKMMLKSKLLHGNVYEALKKTLVEEDGDKVEAEQNLTRNINVNLAFCQPQQQQPQEDAFFDAQQLLTFIEWTESNQLILKQFPIDNDAIGQKYFKDYSLNEKCNIFRAILDEMRNNFIKAIGHLQVVRFSSDADARNTTTNSALEDDESFLLPDLEMFGDTLKTAAKVGSMNKYIIEALIVNKLLIIESRLMELKLLGKSIRNTLESTRKITKSLRKDVNLIMNGKYPKEVKLASVNGKNSCISLSIFTQHLNRRY